MLLQALHVGIASPTKSLIRPDPTPQYSNRSNPTHHRPKETPLHPKQAVRPYLYWPQPARQTCLDWAADEGHGGPRPVSSSRCSLHKSDVLADRNQQEDPVRPSADSNLPVKPSSSRRARQRHRTGAPSCRDRRRCEHGPHLQPVRAFTLPLLGFGLRALLADTLSFPHHLVTGL